MQTLVRIHTIHKDTASEVPMQMNTEVPCLFSTANLIHNGTDERHHCCLGQFLGGSPSRISSIIYFFLCLSTTGIRMNSTVCQSGLSRRLSVGFRRAFRSKSVKDLKMNAMHFPLLRRTPVSLTMLSVFLFR